MFRQPILQRRFHFDSAMVGGEGNAQGGPRRGGGGNFTPRIGLPDKFDNAGNGAFNLIAGAPVDLQRLANRIRHILADDFGVLEFAQ